MPIIKILRKKILLFFFLRIENSYYQFNNPNSRLYENFFLSIYWGINLYRLKAPLLENKTHSSIVFDHLLFSQKSFKYLLSLPIKGQRTWSNKKTAKKNNSFLINYKIKQIQKHFSGNINLLNLKNLIFINYFNWIWRVFWKKDWIFLYKKNKKYLKQYSYSKNTNLTLNKLLTYKPPKKKHKVKNQLDLRIFFNFIGLDRLIKLPK